jgi:hypothetical protein
LYQQRSAAFIELNLKDNELIQPFVTRKYRIFEYQSDQELNHGEEQDSEGEVQSEIENFDIDRELNQEFDDDIEQESQSEVKEPLVFENEQRSKSGKLHEPLSE